MSKPDAPKAPDPKATAAAQTDQSVATAIANTMMGQVGQSTPNGSLRYDQTGSYTMNGPGGSYEIPRFTAVTEYTPEGKAINDANQGTQLNLANFGRDQSGRLGELLSRPMDFSGAPAGADRSVSRVPTFGATPGAPQYSELNTGGADLVDSYRTDRSGDRQTYEDALFARIDPKLSQQRETIQRELAGRGIRPGSAAYDRAMEEYGKTANDARYGAIINASGEQVRMEGLDRDAAGFTNSSRQQSYANQIAETMYNNQMRGQGFSDEMLRTGRDDATKSNVFSMQQQELDGQDRGRATALNERMIERNQPLQELLSIMSGTALENPNFAIAAPERIANTDVAGITQQGYQNQMAAYQQQMAQYNAMMGGLMDLGGSFLGSPMFGKKAAATG